MEPDPFLVASLATNGKHTLLSLPLADAIAIALMVFVAGLLLGLWCGWTWQRRRTWSHAADDLKRRAQRG